MRSQPVRFYQTGASPSGTVSFDEHERTVSRSGRSNSLDSGHRACQGCGEALGARYALDRAMRATQGRLIAVNATGCLECSPPPTPRPPGASPGCTRCSQRPGRGHRGGGGMR